MGVVENRDNSRDDAVVVGQRAGRRDTSRPCHGLLAKRSASGPRQPVRETEGEQVGAEQGRTEGSDSNVPNPLRAAFPGGK
ncbi:hypothetical protein ABIB35_001829 [Arthrobacter sp. UYP6]